MAERSVPALPSDDETDLAITALAAARIVRLNDETVTVAQCRDPDGLADDGFGIGVRNGMVSFL